jgi:hypothetical protein
MPVLSLRSKLNELTLAQLRSIGAKHSIALPPALGKASMVSRLLTIPKGVLEREIKALPCPSCT